MKIRLPKSLHTFILGATLSTGTANAHTHNPPVSEPSIGWENPASHTVTGDMEFTSYPFHCVDKSESPTYTHWIYTRIKLTDTHFTLSADTSNKGRYNVTFNPDAYPSGPPIIGEGYVDYTDPYRGQAFNLTGHSGLVIENLNILSFLSHDCRQTYNSNGSAISAADSPVTLQHNNKVIFDNNHAPNGAGGAIATWDSPVSLAFNGELIFSGNTCNAPGGAIYHNSTDNAKNDNSPLSIKNNTLVTFSDNKASTGGAIYAHDSNIKITGNTTLAFTRNHAISGPGGAIGASIAAEKSITISNNGSISFASNQSSANGGALDGASFFSGNQAVHFSDNKSGAWGGAINTPSLSSMNDNGDISFRTNISGDSGGAIRCKDFNLLDNKNILFDNNMAATNGGAIATENAYGGTLQIMGNELVEFANNTANQDGGAIYSSRGSLNLSENKTLSFTKNHATQHGGAIFLKASGYYHDIQITNNGTVHFDANISSGNGGAIRLDGNALSIIGNKSVAFTNNGAGGSGGAIDFNFDLSITDNDRTTFRGNYIHVQNGAVLNAIHQSAPYGSGRIILAANQGKTLSLYDPIILESDAPVILNRHTPPGADAPIVSTGTIVLSGEHAAGDLDAILASENITPDAAARQQLLDQSRLTSVRGQTTLYGGTFLVKENAVYQGSNYRAEAGSITHLRNGGQMTFQQKAVFTPGSTLILSGNRPVSLTAASVSMQGASLEFRLSGTGTTPLLTLNGNTDLSGATFNLLADTGHTSLSSGTYTLLQINGGLSQTSSITLNLVGITADKSELAYNPETKTWTWTSEDITVEKPADPDEPGIAGDPEETPGTPETPGKPERPQSADIPSGLADASINTLWASTQNLDSFSGLLRNHSTRISLDATGRGTVWFDTIGNFYRQSSNGNHAGYDYSAWGAALGGEYQVEPHLQIGAGLGHTFGKNTTKLGYGRIDQDTLLGGAYANIRLMQQQQHSLWLSTTGAFGIARNHGAIASPDLPGIGMRGSWDETVWQLDMRLAWSYAITQSTAVYAFAGIQYATGKQDSFTLPGENGDYRFTGNSLNRTRIPVGIGIRHNLAAWSFMADASVIPDIARTNPAARIQDSQGNRTTVRGVDPGRCAFEFNLGTAYSLTDNWSLTAGYGITTTGDTVQQNARIGTSYAF